MKPITASREINAPLDLVFHCISDPGTFRKAIPHITDVEFLSAERADEHFLGLQRKQRHVAAFHLDAPVGRVCSAEVPVPYPKHLETAALPQVADIIAAVKALPSDCSSLTVAADCSLKKSF